MTTKNSNKGTTTGGIIALGVLAAIGLYLYKNGGSDLLSDLTSAWGSGSGGSDSSGAYIPDYTAAVNAAAAQYAANYGTGTASAAAPILTGGVSGTGAATTKKEAATGGTLNSIYGTNGGTFTGNVTYLNTQTDGAAQWKLETTTGYDVYLTGGSGNLADYITPEGTLKTQAYINAAGIASKKEAASTTYGYVATNDGRYISQKGAQNLANTDEWTATRNESGTVTSLTKKESTGASKSSGKKYVTSTGGVDSGGSGKRKVTYSDGSSGTIDN